MSKDSVFFGEIQGREVRDTDVHMSYSAFSQYLKCPKQWKLNYIDKHKTFTDSISTVFGTAMHEVLQSFLTTMFNVSVRDADQMDLEGMLKEKMMEEYLIRKAKGGGNHFVEQHQMEEHYQDGVEILRFFKKNRGYYFNRTGYELVGIEYPIYHQVVDGNENVVVKGFIDVILRDKKSGKLIVYDIKTSTKGWTKYAKMDKTKTSQLLIYKIFLAKQLNVPVDMIDVKYFIVKRKLYDEIPYPQKRIQEFSPPSGKTTRKQLIKQLEVFVEHAFNADGSYKTENNFVPVGGKGLKNCKWCPFKEREDLCPKDKRFRDG